MTDVQFRLVRCLLVAIFSGIAILVGQSIGQPPSKAEIDKWLTLGNQLADVLTETA